MNDEIGKEIDNFIDKESEKEEINNDEDFMLLYMGLKKEDETSPMFSTDDSFPTSEKNLKKNNGGPLTKVIDEDANEKNNDGNSSVENISEEPLTKVIDEDSLVKNNDDDELISNFLKPKPTIPEKELKEKTDELLTNISNQIEILEEKQERLKIEDYTKFPAKMKKFENFLLNKQTIPMAVRNSILLANLIRGTTDFSTYDPFNTIDLQMMHDIPTKVLALKRMNKIFKYKFIDESKFNRNYRMNDLDQLLGSFFNKHSKVPTLVIEYRLIKVFLTKLIVSLNSVEELGFKDNSKPTMNLIFKLAISKELDSMKQLQNSEGKSFKSWNKLIVNLLDINPASCKIYRLENLNVLQRQIDEAFNVDFKLEELIAHMLKTYLPSITYNYLFAIRSIYILARLFSIYLQTTTDKTEIFEDLHALGIIAIATYENKYHIVTQTARTYPKYQREISPQTLQYINTHILTGPQYYLLKMLEKSFKIIANQIKK